jgi:NADH:ubiquinone oxidoreductase subunit 6 (subunit J)
MRIRITALAAVVFGLVTILAGARVLTGSDPGYVVFRPLLIFNTIMGFVYVAAGVQIWRNERRGRLWAHGIALVNLVVLLVITALYVRGWSIAVDSLAAMTVRTMAWGGARFALRSTP